MKLKKLIISIAAALFAVVSALADTQKVDGWTWIYTLSNGEASILGVEEQISGELVIPAALGGHPVTTIESEAFADSLQLCRVTFSDGLKKIGSGAFLNCSILTTVTIPAAVTNIGASAFFRCKGMASIEVEKDNQFYASVDGVLYDKAIRTLMQCPAGISSVEIPETVEIVSPQAFYFCANIGSLHIPASVAQIGVFAGCDSLTNLTVDAMNRNFCAVDNVMYDHDKKTLVSCLPTCKAVDIPKTVQRIGYFGFLGCTNLVEIALPTGLREIGVEAFEECWSLESIALPANVRNIPDMAFYNCKSLKEVKLLGAVTNIGECAFYSCLSLKSLTLPAGLKQIGRSAFVNCQDLELTFKGTPPQVDEDSWSRSVGECKRGYYSASPEKWERELDTDCKWHGLSMSYLGLGTGSKRVIPLVADAAGGKVSGNASVKPDKQGAYKPVTLKATPNKGYWFAGWYDAGGERASGDLSFKAAPGDGDMTAYEARFVPAQSALCGTYNGSARVNLKGMTLVKGADTSADVYGDYPVTVTLSAAGKVSGAVTVAGKKVAFKTDCCDELFIGGDGSSWATFGAALDEKAWFGVDNRETVQVRLDSRSFSTVTGLAHEGACAPLGSEDSLCLISRDSSKDAAVKAKLKTLAGTYAAFAADDKGHVVPLSVVVDTAGKAKITGKFYDGSALSASVVLGGYGEDMDGSDDAEWWTYGEAFLSVKSLGGGNLHLELCGSLGDDEVEPTLSLSDVRVTSYSATSVAANPVSLDDRTWTLSRFDATAWFPADADPDFGVVRLTTGEDVVDILYASKNGKITGLGKALQPGFTVKFDAKTGLFTVTKGKAYTIQGVLDYEGGCCAAGRINADKTCEPVDIAFETLPRPEESFPWTEDGFELTLGRVFDGEMQPSVMSEDGPLALTVSGLPSGLKYDKTTGRITGAPTKAGTFTVKVGYTYATRKITRTTTLVVAPMPEDLPVGTYAGFATVYVDGTNFHDHVECPFTATVDKKGALSGSITLFGKKATFKASGYDYSGDGCAGYTVTLDLKAIDKTWGVTTFRLEVSSNDVYIYSLELFGNGKYLIWSVTAWRDRTKEADRADRVAPYVGTYVAALDTFGGWFDEDSYGVSAMSVTVDKKGTAKLAGTFADGTAFTASAPLAVFEDEDGSWAYVDVVAVPKSLAQGGMCISLAFSAQEDAASGAKKVALECGVSASKYVRTSGDFAEFGLYQNFAYRYSSLAWVDTSLFPMETCLGVRCDNESFADVTFAWKTKTVAGDMRISGVGSRLSGPSMTFKIDDKTGRFSGTCGKYKIFGAMEKGTCSGVGTVVGKDGSVGCVTVLPVVRW